MTPKIQRSWILYDWANSAFATTVMAGFFPVFFKTQLSAGVDATVSTANLGFANSLGSLFVALLAPLMGAVADKGGYKKRFLAIFTYLGVLTTACLSILEKGDWQMAMYIYAVAILGFGGSTAVYDSLLPSIAKPKELDRLSSNGFAFGYLGGGILFTINLLMLLKPSFFGLKNGFHAVQWAFISVSVWWGFFSLFLFKNVPEPPATSSNSFTKNILDGAKELKSTFKKIRQYKMIMLFLIGYLLYADGVGTTMKMAVDFGLSIGFHTNDLMIALLIVQFVGLPATIGFGRVAEKFHPKNGIFVCITVYLIALVWASVMTKTYEFYLLACLIGSVQGGIQALSRSFYCRLFPLQKAGEFFGFYNLLGKFSGIIGPLLIAWTSLTFNSTRAGILSISILFIAGGAVLYKVQAPELEAD